MGDKPSWFNCCYWHDLGMRSLLSALAFLLLVASASAQRSTGTFTLGSTTSTCPATANVCYSFTVSGIAGMSNATGALAYMQTPADGGTYDVFFTGDTGGTWWGGSGLFDLQSNIKTLFTNLSPQKQILVRWTTTWY